MQNCVQICRESLLMRIQIDRFSEETESIENPEKIFSSEKKK